MSKKKGAGKAEGKRFGAGRISELGVRLQQHLREKRWAGAGQRVGVAVSGGADSVGLLFLLLELRAKLGIVLSVVHFNHKLRGRASEADEKFVAKLAARFDLPFYVERENIAAKSKRERRNLEDAARRGRYAFFSRLVAEGRADRIAVAHTADDQAETVLAHILRGTGLAGLGGIHPEVGCVFRPLLRFRRDELRGYLKARRQDWKEDATNRDTKRMRARIRLKLMPLLEKNFQPAVVEHLCQLGDLAREDEAWLESSAELRVFLNAKEEKGEWRISLRDLIGAPGRFEQKSNSSGAKAQFLPESDVGAEAPTPDAKHMFPRGRQGISSAAKAGTEVAAVTARLKPCPDEKQESHTHSQAPGARLDNSSGAKARFLPESSVGAKAPPPGALTDDITWGKREEFWTRNAPEAMSKRMIRLLVRRAKPQWGQLSAVHVDAVLRMAQQPDSGKLVQLPGGVEVRRQQDLLVFRAAGKNGPRQMRGAQSFSYTVELSENPTEVALAGSGCCLRFTVIDWPGQGRETSRTGAVLDRGRVRVPLVVRNWRPGDSMQPIGHQKRHKLSRLLNELGVSRWEKACWPVVACGEKVAWAKGLRVSVEFAADSSTREGVAISEVPIA